MSFDISNFDFEKLAKIIDGIGDKLTWERLKSIIRNFFPNYSSYNEKLDFIVDVLIDLKIVRSDIRPNTGYIYCPYIPIPIQR